MALLLLFALILGSPKSLCQVQSTPATSPERALRQHIEKFEQYRSTDTLKALRFARLAIEEADSLHTPLELAPLLDYLSTYNENQEFRYHEALRLKRRAADLYEKMESRSDIARTTADLGRLYLKEGDYHAAYTYARRAQYISRSLRDTLHLREAYLTIEQVEFYYHQDVEQAMEYNRRVSDTFHGREQADQAVRALNNRFNYNPSPEEVQNILARCEAICHQWGFNDMLLNVYLNVAMKEMLFGDMEACKRYLDLSKPLISNFKEEGYYYSALGFYHLNLGDKQQAIEDTRRSIERLTRGDFDAKNVHSYFLLQELYQEEGAYREAYNALREFAEIYTRQINTEDFIGLSKSISELELKRIREWHLFVIVLLILGVVMLAFAIILFYSRHKLAEKNRRLMAEKAEQELNNKNELIKIQKLQQFQEQQRINNLTEELSAAIGKSDNKTMRTELNRIILHLRKSAGSGNDWAEVEKTMLGSNDAFFEKLLKAYPNLTKNERKLCTLIHMNLSTKEISNITHQSMGSINIARSRLRQKFGLTGSDRSLIAFLDRFGGNE